MSQHGTPLPQLNGDLFLTDGGLETTMIFDRGLTLPHFASYILLLDQAGREELKGYLEPYLHSAKQYGVGLILETPTWRASADWGGKLGHDARFLDEVNRSAVQFLRDQVNSAELTTPVVVSGCMGPRGDGYQARDQLTPEQAREYHSAQIQSFKASGADQVSAMTLTYPEEAVGFALAARDADMDIVLSFTVETDGRIPCGASLQEAIETVERETDRHPAYYMVNCAYPTHMEPALTDGIWLERIRGLKPNASSKSHAELNECEQIDRGDVEDFARRCHELRRRLPHLNVFGGCCGTGVAHFEKLAARFRERLNTL